MPLPTYQDAMLPLLEFSSDQQEHSLREATNAVADYFCLNDAERALLLGSGRKPIIDDRVGWARTYLGQAKILESTRRGVFRITERGLSLLATKPSSITDQTLKQYSEFAEFLTRKAIKKKAALAVEVEPSAESESTPEESLERASLAIRSSLASDILDVSNIVHPIFSRGWSSKSS
ncbi:MAG: winged helix-turn-helix domain-containing protein [Pyrinomonadaceae bacterium]